MTDVKTAVVQLAVVRELMAYLKVIDAELVDVLDANLDEGDAKAAVLPDKTKLGKASKVTGRRSVYVQDDGALLNWVKANRPDEVVEAVRPGFVAHLIDQAKRDGELVPGLDVKWGAPYVRFTSDAGAREAIAWRWRELLDGVLDTEPAELEAS